MMRWLSITGWLCLAIAAGAAALIVFLLSQL